MRPGRAAFFPADNILANYKLCTRASGTLAGVGCCWDALARDSAQSAVY